MKPIAFIGMPGSGKSTISKLVADVLSFDYFDSDQCVEQQFGLPIVQIFEQFGEIAFREAETKIITELCSKQNVVLSFGGGAILNNGTSIHITCTVIYLTRSIDHICSALLEQTGTRPLARSKTDLLHLYEARRELYEHNAHIIIHNDGTPEQSTKSILEELTKCGY
jgi:shikimate kinase